MLLLLAMPRLQVMCYMLPLAANAEWNQRDREIKRNERDREMYIVLLADVHLFAGE